MFNNSTGMTRALWVALWLCMLWLLHVHIHPQFWRCGCMHCLTLKLTCCAAVCVPGIAPVR